ncbi:sulfite exporter TauE/SafE family protein [Roseibacillus persicicus]|uniref:sulfite exporter TauE/SafE family protein n=1 Tax=Roseibacillus persicicus TaxID=454148 RepID=UPI00398B5486
MTIYAILGALIIGLTLGLTGAGGSIITLPVLVYLAKISPLEAVPMSLLIVGAAALTGALQRLSNKEICLPTAGVFAVSGMVGAVGGARLTPLVSPQVLMLIFAALMLLVAIQMFRPKPEASERTEKSWQSKAAAGLGVGVLTGFIGVGGGFLLVPALLKFGGLKMKEAVGSSLAIIFFNCIAGFLSHLGQTSLNWTLSGTYAGLAVIGVLLGTHFSTRLPARVLRQGFATMVVITGGFVLWKNLGS